MPDASAPNAVPTPPGVARIEWALRERVKELTCLYGIAQVAERAGDDLDAALGGIVALLPPAWQYPEITAASVIFEGRSFDSDGTAPAVARLSAEIVVGGMHRGEVVVCYREARPAADEGPFLREERALVHEVARQIGLLIERHEDARERARLHQQLWRSERLGTIGQLAAGLAHELNEPLGSILGYAQLAQRSFGLPDQTGRDLAKVVRATLHARDIVRRLLLFARETTTRQEPVTLDELVRGSLFLLETRCRRAGVKIVLHLPPGLPPVLGDRSLLEQAFLNLAFNGIQAMPAGGRLTVTLAAAPDALRWTIEDTGSGMSPEVLAHCFDPFFTTREVGQGTGLGLPVTHGIIGSHGGTIEAESTPGAGSRFVILLPVAGPARGGPDGTR